MNTLILVLHYYLFNLILVDALLTIQDQYSHIQATNKQQKAVIGARSDNNITLGYSLSTKLARTKTNDSMDTSQPSSPSQKSGSFEVST